MLGLYLLDCLRTTLTIFHQVDDCQEAPGADRDKRMMGHTIWGCLSGSSTWIPSKRIFKNLPLAVVHQCIHQIIQRVLGALGLVVSVRRMMERTDQRISMSPLYLDHSWVLQWWLDPLRFWRIYLSAFLYCYILLAISISGPKRKCNVREE
jgi:hypothetical protein